MSGNLLPRIEARESCTVGRADGSVGRAVLLNLSSEGFCIESNRALKVGERIEVGLPGWGRFAGVVRWRDCHRAGCAMESYLSGAHGL
jgi:hypothetical protein